MSALYGAVTRMIERGQTDGLAEKVDAFYKAGHLDGEEYNELKKLLKDRN